MNKKLSILILILLSSMIASAQTVSSTLTINQSSATVTFVNQNLATTASFREQINGLPTTSSITISGCTTQFSCTVLDTYTGNSTTTRTPSISVGYPYFSVGATWTGGVTQVSIVVTATLSGGSQQTNPNLWLFAQVLSGSAPSGNCSGFNFFYVSTSGSLYNCPVPGQPFNSVSGGSGAFAGGLGTSYQDVSEIASPGNPSAGHDRLYLDSTSHQFTCLTSAGGNCNPSSGSMVWPVTAGIPIYSGSSSWSGSYNASSPIPANLIAFTSLTSETTTYLVTTADFAANRTFYVPSGTFTITLVANTSQPPAGEAITIVNYGTGVVTVAANGQNINGGATSITLPAALSNVTPYVTQIFSDGTNYFAWTSTPARSITGSGSSVLANTPTIATPNFTTGFTIGGTAANNHGLCGNGTNYVDCATFNIAQIPSIPIADINATGTPSSSTFLRGDGTWSAPAGSGTVNSGTVNGMAYYTGSTAVSSVTPPTVNGSYLCGYSVTASAAVVPTCNLTGVPVDSTNPATLLYSDRANFLNWTSGTALALPAVTSNFASNLPFSLLNTSGSTLTVTPNAGASDTCNGASTCTVANDIFGMFYSTGSAPGSWYKIGLVTDLIGVTSSASLTNHGVLLGAGTLAIGATAAGTAGYPLTSGGASANPSFTAPGTLATVTVTVDTSTPVTVSGTNLSTYHFNENATAATAVTYNLPTAAAGIQKCFTNAYNGTAANTGVLTIATSASGQFIIFTDGTLSATGGNVTSGGAAHDAACVVGVDSTHWQLFVQSGTWTKH